MSKNTVKVSNVYAYYQHYPDFRNDYGLISECAESWHELGWTFEVVGPALARQHPRYEEMKKAVASFPTVNHPGFEESCFLRWLAYDLLGESLLIDYDVANFGLEAGCEIPKNCFMMECEHEYGPPVFWEKEVTSRLVDTIIGWNPELHEMVNGKPHLGDIFIIARTVAHGLDRWRKCALFEHNSNWKLFPLIHFANYTTSRQNIMWTLRTNPINNFREKQVMYQMQYQKAPDVKTIL